jgi:hypothetical protein
MAYSIVSWSYGLGLGSQEKDNLLPENCIKHIIFLRPDLF